MRILGIELGSLSVKAVEVESRFRRFDILELHELILPQNIKEPNSVYKDKIKELFARLPTNPDKIVTSLPLNHVTVRFLHFPIKQKKKVEKTFRFELEDMVPFSIEEAILQHHISTDKDGAHVFCALAPEKLVKAHVEWLQLIGIDPDWLTFEGMGITNLYYSIYNHTNKTISEDSCVLLVDIGHASTKMVIFDGYKPCFFRAISWGGKNLSQLISKNLDVTIDIAEKLKISSLNMELPDHSTAKEQQLFMIGEDILLSLIADINHFIMAFRSKYSKQVSSILITGGLSKLKGIDTFLSKNLTLPVEKFSYFGLLGIRNEIAAEQSSFSEVIGRALVFARKVPFLFNFRRHTVAKVSSLEELVAFVLTPNVKKLMIYILVFLFVLFIHAKAAIYIGNVELTKKNEEKNKFFQEVFGSSIPTSVRKNLISNPKDLEKYIDQKNSELKQKLSLLSRNRHHMINLITTISRAFPKEVKVDVNTLLINDKNFTIEGVIYEGDILLVKKNLDEVKIFNNINFSISDKRFTINGEVEGG